MMSLYQLAVMAVAPHRGARRILGRCTCHGLLETFLINIAQEAQRNTAIHECGPADGIDLFLYLHFHSLSFLITSLFVALFFVNLRTVLIISLASHYYYLTDIPSFLYHIPRIISDGLSDILYRTSWRRT